MRGRSCVLPFGELLYVSCRADKRLLLSESIWEQTTVCHYSSRSLTILDGRRLPQYTGCGRADYYERRRDRGVGFRRERIRGQVLRFASAGLGSWFCASVIDTWTRRDNSRG